MKTSIPWLPSPWPTGDPAIAWHGELQPVGLHRPQTVQFGRNQRGARTILHPDDVEFRSELQIRWFQERVGGPLQGPIAVAMEFQGNTTNRHGRRAPRPDLSNLVKACEDAANAVLWHDDRNIARLAAAIRRWDRDATPFVALWVWPHDGGDA